MKSKVILAAVFALGVVMPAAVDAAGSGPFGNWTMTDGTLTVRVSQCRGNLVCAEIARLPDPNNGDGTPKLDLKNKNPALRSRRLIGLPVMDGMIPTGPNTFKGKIYSSDDGNYYRAYATVTGDRLNVRGCWFVICKNLNFNRSK